MDHDTEAVLQQVVFAHYPTVESQRQALHAEIDALPARLLPSLLAYIRLAKPPPAANED